MCTESELRVFNKHQTEKLPTLVLLIYGNREYTNLLCGSIKDEFCLLICGDAWSKIALQLYAKVEEE